MSAYADALPCCKRGLLMLDGRFACRRHRTEREAALLAEADRRAVAVGLRGGSGGVEWPYGPNVHLGSRLRMLDWAETYGLRLSHGRTCLGWVASGRCGRGQCRAQSHADWMDHITTWQGEDRRVLVSQPYGLTGKGKAALDDLRDAFSVRVHSESWYGHGTVQIEVSNRVGDEKGTTGD